jgi:hypothetical protein
LRQTTELHLAIAYFKVGPWGSCLGPWQNVWVHLQI